MDHMLRISELGSVSCNPKKGLSAVFQSISFWKKMSYNKYKGAYPALSTKNKQTRANL